MKRLRISLDATTRDRRAVHELVADPEADDELPDEPIDAEHDAPQTAFGAFEHLDAELAEHRASQLELEAAQAEVRAAEFRSHAAAARHDADDKRWIADLTPLSDLAREMVGRMKAAYVERFTPQERVIFDAIIAITLDGADPSRHEIARRAGINHGSVSRAQRAITRKIREVRDGKGVASAA